MIGFPEGRPWANGGLCKRWSNQFTRKLWRQFRIIQQQGPRINFEIGGGGGGGTISASILGEGHKTLFLTNSIILKIFGGRMPLTPPPTPRARSLSNTPYSIFGAKRVKTAVDTYLVYFLNCVQFSEFEDTVLP